MPVTICPPSKCTLKIRELTQQLSKCTATVNELTAQLTACNECLETTKCLLELLNAITAKNNPTINNNQIVITDLVDGLTTCNNITVRYDITFLSGINPIITYINQSITNVINLDNNIYSYTVVFKFTSPKLTINNTVTLNQTFTVNGSV